MTPINEVLDVLRFGFSLQKGISESLADDGKVTLSDTTKFIPAVIELPAAIINIQDAPKQWYEMDEEAKQQIRQYVQNEFDLQDDILEFLIEDTIKEVADLTTLARRWARYRKPAEAGTA